MDGFDPGNRELPRPPVDVTDDTRDRLAQTIYAMVAGHTPEEIAGFLEDGFPEGITESLERPGEREEMRDHVDVLLSIVQAPAVTA